MTLYDFVVLAENGWNDHHDDGWWVVMGIGMIVFWVLAIALVVWLVRTWAPGRRAAERESPLEVLERRFAEGAISVEEYQERRRILGGNGNPP